MAPAGTPRPAPRRPRVEQSEEEEDYLGWEEHEPSMDCDDDDEEDE